MRQGEHHMIIGCGQQLGGLVFEPLLPTHTTTVGAMPVATVVVLIMMMTTDGIAATKLMNPLLCRMALTQGLKYLLTVWVLSLLHSLGKNYLL